ncbi:group 1 glycosyl transferase [Candidatus Magnetomorum sp. HK-1]|nr:group 1 glycosyl transferase [Candidatus Magnetomorum sp. HK-1]
MKCHCIFKFVTESAGGGNAFLTNLVNDFESKGRYTQNPEQAQIFLMNSHHNVEKVLTYRRKYPDHLFVHRIDGPMKSYNKIKDWRDDIVRFVNHYVADATIFQSQWSKLENQRLKLTNTALSTVIPNAPNPVIFNTQQRNMFLSDRKPRLIASSWSTNWKKGFKTLDWLDKNLDFDKYDMTFIGNSPVSFKNIRHIPPVQSLDMASWLKQSDVYIFTSAIEACSNALLEALHCGVPVVGVNSSSNPEFIGQGGELYNDPSEIPYKIGKIFKNYSVYQKSIQNPRLSEIGDQYYDFMETCVNAQKNSLMKRLGNLRYVQIKCLVLAWKIFGKLEAMRQ